MAKEFVPIKIISLNDSASKRIESGSAIVRIVLELSESAPSEWANFFNVSWKQHIYMMKRRAEVHGRQLIIECVPEELQKDHMPELKKVINDTNEAYGRYQTQIAKTQQAEADAKASDAAKLAELKKKIKFD